jgi:hypothetical protein
MAAINRVQYHPPPLSFCKGPRILQKSRDVVFQIVELPLYILPSLVWARDKRFRHQQGAFSIPRTAIFQRKASF